ncbi:glycosyltransferase family 2 protein [Candidatus Pacearchaeota archaeon]|nr:glycosyltransferase family 2 protein [Candidatus Pacearchaeota archaeon]
MKLNKQPKVSIVFVNWNGKKYTFDLAESLKKINYNNYDIIIVDNASTDGSQKEIKRKYGKNVTLIENKENTGLAEGTNIGLREGLKRGSKYILTMNNDMIVKPNFLDILVNSMEEHPEVAVSAPLIYYMYPKNLIWCAGCKYTIRGFKPLYQGKKDTGNLEEKYVDGCDCVLMMRSKILEKDCLLDKDFFVIHEFTEWCLRITNKGYKCLFVPESKVWHKVEASLKGNNKESEISAYYNIRNWLLTVKKNKSFFYFVSVLMLESTILAFFRLIKWRQVKLIKTYFTAVWHAIINKTPMKLYPY